MPASPPRTTRTGSRSRLSAKEKSTCERRADRVRLAMADNDLAYLNDRGEIGVVGDVGHDLFCVRAKAGLKAFHRVTEDMAHAHVGSRTAGLATGEAFVDGVIQAGIAHTRLYQRHVLVAIVRVVESCSCSVRVHHADLDHERPPLRVSAQHRSATVREQVRLSSRCLERSRSYRSSR